MGKSDEERDRQLAARLKSHAYERRDEFGRPVLGVNMGAPALKYTPIRRCQNCLHWDQGERMDRFVKDVIARDRKLMEEHGNSEAQIRDHLSRAVATLATDRYGLCLIKDRRTDENIEDFSHVGARCDKWEGRIVLTPQEARSDPDAAEIYHKAKMPDPNRKK